MAFCYRCVDTHWGSLEASTLHGIDKQGVSSRQWVVSGRWARVHESLPTSARSTFYPVWGGGRRIQVEEKGAATLKLEKKAGLSEAGHKLASLPKPEYKVRLSIQNLQVPLEQGQTPSDSHSPLAWATEEGGWGNTYLEASKQERKRGEVTLVAPFLLSVCTNPH